MRRLHLGIIAIISLMLMSLVACKNEQNEVTISSAEVSLSNMYADMEATAEESQETEESTDEQEIETTAFVSIKDAKVGDYIQFGSYEQDGDKKNGREQIEWIVLDKKDDTILILSRYVVVKKAFNSQEKAAGWGQCSLRKWLNEDFLQNAFSDTEKGMIIETEIDNPGSAEYFKEFNKKSGTANGKKTKDNVFLLSYQEVLEYFKPKKVEKYMLYAGKNMITKAVDATGIESSSLSANEYETFYKESGWPQDCVDAEGSGWFLRTNGINPNEVMSVGYDGAMRAQYVEYGGDYESATFEGGIRPAMWIKCK